MYRVKRRGVVERRGQEVDDKLTSDAGYSGLTTGLPTTDD
jgi:hypothetical protein